MKFTWFLIITYLYKNKEEIFDFDLNKIHSHVSGKDKFYTVQTKQIVLSKANTQCLFFYNYHKFQLTVDAATYAAVLKFEENGHEKNAINELITGHQ